MAGGRRFGGSNFTASLQNRRVPCSSEPLDPLFLSGSSPSFFGPRSMVSFEDINGGNRSERPFFHPFDQEHPGDDDLDEHSHHPEKKRRLSGDQVQLLERSFEVENKLEPERKFQLAKNLGLQPRQVAIWFQNRRARWKTKQLEKDYEALQARYSSLKADYDGLHEETERLKAEVLVLTDKLLVKEKQRGNSGIVLPEQNIVDPALKDEASKVLNVVCDLSPAKSDVSESDSPRTVDGGHSSFASNAFEPDQSDVSQDEEDELNMTLLPPHIFPKMEDPDNPSNPYPNSCDFSFPIEDHNAFWSWSY